MARVLVSLISEQTIPNVEFIKAMKGGIDHYLFISTEKMEKRGERQWIMNTVKLQENKVLETLIVDPFSFENIAQQLVQIINDEDVYIVNLTGGTKIMSLAVYEFFKEVRSEMYYLTGYGNTMIRIHPGRQKITSKLDVHISLSDYLSAYGFQRKNEAVLLSSMQVAEQMLTYFIHKFNKDLDAPVLEQLRRHRGKNWKNWRENNELKAFLERIGFEPENENKLSKYECRYLSGEWLEEYLYCFLRDNFEIAGDSIAMGLSVEKNNSPNEFDVLLMRNNKIYLFECKTSIYLDSSDSQTFIGETIYKSDSLRNKFGLRAQTTVVTLSDLSNPKLKSHLDRAEASQVKLIDRSAFINKTLLDQLKKI